MRLVLVLILCFGLCSGVPAHATPPERSVEQSIRAVLDKQTTDWNRGDLDAFATGYKNSPDILFIGSTVRRGYAGMIQSYRKGYPNKTAMGVLSFSNVEVHPLDAQFATVLGNFHLERSAAGGGNADGIYSLVLEKTPAGWKVILDHTSSTTTKKPS